MSLYAKGYVVIASRNATTLEWMLLDAVESLVQLPARFVKWNGNFVNPGSWLKPDGWRALILVMGRGGHRAAGRSQGSGSFESTVDELARLCRAERERESRPIYLLRLKRDRHVYGPLADLLPENRILNLDPLASLTDEGPLGEFVRHLCAALGRDVPPELIEQVLNESRRDLTDAREFVGGLISGTRRTRSRVPHLSTVPRTVVAAPHRHRVPLLGNLSKGSPDARAELVRMSVVLSEYGFNFQHFSGRYGVDWSWVSQREFAVVSALGDDEASRHAAEIKQRFESALVDQSTLRTRRYFLDSSGELQPASVRAILPIVSWSSRGADDIEPVLRMQDPSEYSFSRWSSPPAESPLPDELDPSFTPSHLLVRDLRSHYQTGAVWRRIFGFSRRPPQRLMSSAKHLVITALDHELRAVIDSPLIAYKSLIDGAPDLYLAYIQARSGELHPILVGCIQSAGRLPAALYTYRLLLQWRPENVIMCGIAGSLAPRPDLEPKIGDIVVATETIDYEYGKIREAYQENRNNLPNVEQQIRAKAAGCTLYPQLRRFYHEEGWSVGAKSAFGEMAKEIIRPLQMNDLWSSGRYSDLRQMEADLDRTVDAFSVGRVHFGASCTGDKVVAANAFKFQLMASLSALNNQIRSVEMEGAAVQRAVERAADEQGRKIDFVMVRGISDDATTHKSDAWQELAAKLAGDYTLRFIQWHLPSMTQPR